MRWIALICLLFVAPFAATAQDMGDDGPGYLAELIQDSLSDAGRDVRIEGFEGALSAQATMDKMTIADDNGIWFTMQDVTLDWSRTALLSGRIEVETLSAQRIEMTRLPETPQSDVPSAAAQPFSLPELPVSVEIGKITADEITLGADVLGLALTVSFEASLSLIDGAGSADLQALRIDGQDGRFDISASYDNASETLAVLLILDEGTNGIAATLLDIPDRPALALRVQGDAPLSDFTANLSLATQGVERLSGQVQLASSGTGAADDATPVDREFSTTLRGDLTPLVADEFDAFFGTAATLTAQGTAFGDGRLDLTGFDLATRSFGISGALTLGTQGWPEAFDISGQIGDRRGTPVRLPLGGEATTVRSMDLSLRYDAAAGNTWEGSFDLQDLTRPDLSIATLKLEGGGTITAGEGTPVGGVDLKMTYGATGIALDDPALATAIGSDLRGDISARLTEDEPLRISRMTLIGEGMDLGLTATIAGLDAGFETDLSIGGRVGNFARFTLLAGQSLNGSGSLLLSGKVSPLGDAFDLALLAATTDLQVGIAQLDPLFGGNGRLTLNAQRDTIGTRITDLDVRTDGLIASGDLNITPTGLAAALDLTLPVLDRLGVGLSGAASFNGAVVQDSTGSYDVEGALGGPDLISTITARIGPADTDYATTGRMTGRVSDLAPYGSLVGQSLAGAATLALTAEGTLADGAFSARVQSLATNLSVGVPALATAMRGTGSLRADVTRSAAGRIGVQDLQLKFPNLTGTAGITTDGASSDAVFDLRLADIALFTPELNGPVTAQGTATQSGTSPWQISVDATGPGGTDARATGTITTAGSTDLNISGAAPLGFANPYIAPRQISGRADFDLRANGPIGLNALSGPVRISDGRLTAPTLGQSLEGIAGTVQLSSGTAQIALGGNSSAGGTLALSGPVSLAGQQNADLTLTLDRIVLRDPQLYETTVGGTITFTGPIAGGARVAGGLTLGRAEVRVPSSEISSLGELPEVTHISAPRDVVATLDRAGLTTQGTPPASEARSGPAYPLDLTISAPSQIFVRGRGLDAELGGQLTLSGTSNNVIATGRFELIRGRLDILQQRFDLTEGYAQLQGDFTPYIRLQATTTADTGTLVSVIVDGPATSPQVRFESSPQLPEDEVLSQLLFGRDLASISPLQAVQLASAISTLAGRGSGGLIGQIRDGLDLDNLDFTTDEAGNAALRAGKYISDNVYTDITIGSDGTSEINLNLDITDDISGRGSFGADGETSVGIFFERDY
ncbi:translocation/assembly module TamB domain-containing protein [Octadecabacter sp. R77987]|uniref:translocation/assembly module TamB domain-containing protein n=1 Tax=Octadecabacter sp. R77987 TaxID=3093874 RepID=UPI00366C5415